MPTEEAMARLEQANLNLRDAEEALLAFTERQVDTSFAEGGEKHQEERQRLICNLTQMREERRRAFENVADSD